MPTDKDDSEEEEEDLDIEDIEDDIDQSQMSSVKKSDKSQLARKSSSMDLGEPTAEEIQDEEEDRAARPIQAMARMFLAKRHACEYGKQVFIKEYDPQRKTYAYVDTRRSPPLRQWTKPRWLGDEDLLEEKVYKSPPGYPERMQTQRQYAFVCHTAKFDDPNVPHLPSCLGVKIEHEELKERMQNPYTANFLPADTQFLWEPNKALFLKNLEALKIKCFQHIDAEAKALKYKLEKAFVDTLNRLYRNEDKIPTWEEASNFSSSLLDEASWRRFDKYRLAMAACRVHTQEDFDSETIKQAASTSGQGGGTSRRGGNSNKNSGHSSIAPLLRGNSTKKGAQEEKHLFNELPTPIDLHEALKVRQGIFEEWRNALLAKRKTKADAVERIRREKLLVHLRAKNPGRMIEEWELDQVQDEEQDKDMIQEEGDSHETRVLKAQALEALKKMNRNRLALAAQKEGESDTGLLDVYRALGTNFSALRDCNPSADRLLSLIDPHGAVAQQVAIALLLQRRYRGWKGRQKYLFEKEKWLSEAGEREKAKIAAANARREAMEEENRRKRRLLGIDPLDQPEEYPWDTRFPCSCQRDVGIRDAAVTIYIKSHVGYLKGRSKKQAGSYLLFRDSNWRSSAGVQRTCLHIDELAQFVKSLPFRQRLIILDVVHFPYPSDDSFFKSRVLYPPPDFYADLAMKSESVVLGSCRIGSCTSHEQFTSGTFESSTNNNQTNNISHMPSAIMNRNKKVFPMTSQPPRPPASDNGSVVSTRSSVMGSTPLANGTIPQEDSLFMGDLLQMDDSSVESLSTSQTSASKRSTMSQLSPFLSNGGGMKNPTQDWSLDMHAVLHNKHSGGFTLAGHSTAHMMKTWSIGERMDELLTHKVKPKAKLVKIGWKFDNKSRESRINMCENSVVHHRLPPPQYADYASLKERLARDQEEKEVREAQALAYRQKQKQEDKNGRSANDSLAIAADGAVNNQLVNIEEQDEESVLSGGSIGSMDEVWDEKVSIFGEAMLDALSGEAADPDSSDLLANQNMANGIISPHKLFGAGMVRVETLYQYLAKRVLESSTKVREEEEILLARKLEEEKEQVISESSELGEAAMVKALGKWHKQEARRRHDNPPRPAQHVTLWSYHNILAESICCFPTPTPPPACTVPKALSVKYRHIDISWEVPDYDGEPVLYFEVQRRELTRLTNQWNTTCVYVDAKGNPIHVRKTRLRIPHLAPGVEIQFRVRGRNHGGWGPFSDESDFFMAGADQQPNTVTDMLGKMVMFGPNQLLQFMSERANQPRLPVQQLGLLQLSSLGRDMQRGGTGAALLRPSVAKLAVAACLRAMRNFPWDRPIQQRACLLLKRLLDAHGAWLSELCRKDEARRLRRVERNLRAQQDLVDDTLDFEEDEEDGLSMKKMEGLTKKERALAKQAAEDAGMMDIMFALASIQLRFGRRDIAMLFAVDDVLKALGGGTSPSMFSTPNLNAMRIQSY